MKLAVISDVHSNLEALEAVLAQIKIQRIKKILVAGDIVGYGSNPNEVLDILIKEKADMVLGDHDRHVVDLSNLKWFNEHAQAALKYTNQKLTKGNKAFLKQLKEAYEATIDMRRIFMVHGSVNDHLREYVDTQASDEALQGMLTKAKAHILIMGHTHVPFVRRVAGRLVINPGSVGQPRDTNPNAAYCIIDPMYMTAAIQRVKYDVDTAAKKIISAGLPRYLAERLFQGR